MGLNQAEDFTFNLCRHSFLSLWSYPNPRGKGGKELCDILVVCEPDILILSVKEVAVSMGGDDEIASLERWRRRAIEASCKQIYGAERWLHSASHVTRLDGFPGLRLPHVKDRRIHRVAVALGGEGKVPLRWGDFGKGFVHVFDEVSLQIVMRELNTIGDFVAYLQAKENLRSKVISNGAGEEDLLALYLHRGRQFPGNFDRIIVNGGLWKKLVAMPEFSARKMADLQSYIWDEIIEKMGKAIIHNSLEYGPPLSESEIAFRVMARETRFARRILGQSFNEFMTLSVKGKVHSRMAPSTSGIVYVFLALPHGTDRKARSMELELRCFVARSRFQDSKTVIGVATEVYQQGKGHSLDVYYLEMDTWTADDQKIAEAIQRELGYFADPVISEVHMDEFPGACPDETHVRT